ncbi:NACHT, LRR and PYD domains-containing protein 12-like [Podargus strigoides]
MGVHPPHTPSPPHHGCPSPTRPARGEGQAGPGAGRAGSHPPQGRRCPELSREGLAVLGSPLAPGLQPRLGRDPAPLRGWRGSAMAREGPPRAVGENATRGLRRSSAEETRFDGPSPASPQHPLLAVEYRDHVAREFCTFKEVNACLGDSVTLSSRYTKLMIVPKTQKRTEGEHEVLGLKERHEEVRRKGANPAITMETLLQPDEKGQIPQSVVLVGAAGTGKTMTSRKIMLDWAKGNLYAQFDYAFYISCREISLSQQGDMLSLGDLILDCCPDRQAPLGDILAGPQRLLFIIDGFEELRFFLDQPKCKLCSSAEEKKPVAIILSSILGKTLLPESSLLITTRPTALQSLGQWLKMECFAEILGFSEAEREEYFHKFFVDEGKARKAISFVKSNDALFTMCLVPIMCWTVCIVLERELGEGIDLSQTPATITELVVSCLSTLLRCGKEDLKQHLKKFLGRLCCLAADGIWKQEVLFEEKEIKEHGLYHPVLCSLFLNETVLRKDGACVNVYSFTHLSFQEFFAGLFYALGDDEDARGRSGTTEKRIKVVLENYRDCKTRLMLVMRFLFGMVNREAKKKLKEITGCDTLPQLEEGLLRWTRVSQGAADGVIYDLNIFHCLRAKKKRLRWECELTLAGCEDLATVLSTSQSLRDLNMGYNNLGDAGVRLLCEGLKHPSCQLEKLRLRCCRISSAGCGDLAAALSTSWRLRELDLAANDLGDAGVRLLCEGLKHPSCRLENMGLQRCQVTSASCGDLATALSASPRLRELHLGDNDIGDPGLRLLCEGLQHPSRRLEELRLRCCRISSASCKDLAAALSTSRSLRELDLAMSSQCLTVLASYLESHSLFLACHSALMQQRLPLSSTGSCVRRSAGGCVSAQWKKGSAVKVPILKEGQCLYRPGSLVRLLVELS